MKSSRFTILLILILGTASGTTAIQITPDTSYSHSINFGDELTNTYSNFTSIKPDLPDISTYVENNLTDFSSDGSKEYIGEEIVEEFPETYYSVEIRLTNVAIGGDDKDGIGMGAGEIFVEGHANGNYTRFPEVDQELALNANENVDVDTNLLVASAYSYNITFEVREADDFDTDDSLGVLSYVPSVVDNETVVLQTNTGEATLTFEVTAFLLDEITAQDILDGNRPYLYIDDETSQTELPNDLVGRIIIGDDDGINAMVLQYFFYWDYEYSPDGGVYSFQLHENDFEAFYVYFDLDDFGIPYRYVFNNYLYTELPGFPNEKLIIIEEGETEMTKSYINDLNEDLQLLLGVNSYQEAEILPLTALNDWEYDSLLNKRENVMITSLMGAKTVKMTVDTSYHTFDLGPGGEMYGYNYTETSQLNDTRIKDWYGLIQDSFDNGTRNWSYVGIDIPEVGPFTFDVTQVFRAPHILSGYQTVAEDSTSYERAKKSYLNISQILEVTVAYNFPSTLDIEYENSLTAGTTSVISLTYNPANSMEVTVTLNYELQANFSFWLVQTSYKKVIESTIKFDLDLGTVSSIADKIGLDEFEIEDRDLNDFLSLTGVAIYPRLFGTILEGTLELDLWEIINVLLRSASPTVILILDVIGFFLDHFTLNFDFSVSGIVRVPISTSDSDVTLNDTELVFEDDKLTHYVELSVSDDVESDFEFIIGETSYGLNFVVDWVIAIGFISPISDYINDLNWVIGTFPDLTLDLQSSSGTSLSIDVPTPTSSTISSTPTSNEPSPTPFLLPVFCLLVIPAVKRRRV